MDQKAWNTFFLSHRRIQITLKVLSVLRLVLRQPILLQPSKGLGEPVLKRYNWLVLEVALGRRDVKPPVDDEHFHLNKAYRQDGSVARAALLVCEQSRH